ncbi:MFS transporter [Phenylobacterium sp.]|jgi:MFS family permease|uniref:MFS transporter n=1 Tax=Phenylobacterium sp. TaxID=1871053 RepID=UPI0037C63F05
MTDAAASSEPVPAPLRQPLAWAWYGLMVIVLASVVGSVNRALIGLAAESIKRTLHLTDAQLGLLTGLALTFVTAIATIPVGWLADRVDRRWLLAACVLIWSAATVGFGLSGTFGAMFLFAMGIAVGEAVLGPITYSVIPDLFPREKWIIANLVFVTCVLLGTYIGMALGGTLFGYVAANASQLPKVLSGLEAWRSTLVLSAISGPALAVMILVMRLKRTTPVAGPSANRQGVAAYFRTNARTSAGIFLGFGLSYAAFGAQSQWNVVILQRVFGESPAKIGQFLGVAGGAASLTGVALAWFAVRLVRPRYGDAAPMLVAQAALLVALLVTLPIPLITTSGQFYALMLAKIAFTFMANSLSPTVLQTMAPAHMRGRVVAIGGTVTVIFGSFMPWLVGMLSDRVFPGHNGILLAMCSVVIPGLLGGLLFLRWGSGALPDTIARVERADAQAAAT